MTDPPRLLDNVKAVLFDVDGTLLDTFEFIFRAFEHAIETHGVPPLDRKSLSQLMGGPLEEVYRTLAPGFDVAALAHTHRAFQSANIGLGRLFPGTLPVLDHLRARDVKLAVVTTRSLRTSIRSLEAVGIATYFDIIISAEDVANPKPHPEPLRKALSSLGVNPREALMVGDTHADIQAGKNADVRTVAALYGFGGEKLLELRPDHAIRDLIELLAL